MIAKSKKSEIKGKWYQINNKQQSNNSITGKIVELNFKRDMTVKIKVVDSIENKTIVGKWSI